MTPTPPLPKLPEWIECDEAVRNGSATALQAFIESQEPAGIAEQEEFRTKLQLALSEALSQRGEAVATTWAVYDSQGFYELHLCEDSASKWCEKYNARANDPLKPYTYRKCFVFDAAPQPAQPARVVGTVTGYQSANSLQQWQFSPSPDAAGLESQRFDVALSTPTAAPAPDHSPGNMAQPIHDPAVTTPREVLVGESPVDRIAAPAQEQPKSDAQIILDIITLFERRPEFKAAFREEWLRYTGVEQQQAGVVVSDLALIETLGSALAEREGRNLDISNGSLLAGARSVLALSQGGG